MAFIYSGVELSPCIVAKAKYALGLPTRYTGNTKNCSPNYWAITIYAVGSRFKCADEKMEQAIRDYTKYF